MDILSRVGRLPIRPCTPGSAASGGGIVPERIVGDIGIPLTTVLLCSVSGILSRPLSELMEYESTSISLRAERVDLLRSVVWSHDVARGCSKPPLPDGSDHQDDAKYAIVSKDAPAQDRIHLSCPYIHSTPGTTGKHRQKLSLTIVQSLSFNMSYFGSRGYPRV